MMEVPQGGHSSTQEAPNTGALAASINFESASAAARSVAGVTVAGRLLHELALAGFTEVAIVTGDGAALPPACLADARRLAPSVAITGTGDKAAIALTGRWLLPATAIEAFIQSETDRIGHAGETYARRIPAAVEEPAAGVGTLAMSDCGAALDLSSPSASAEILRGTVKPLDGPVSRHFNRPVSRLFSTLLLKVPAARPIHATFGTALLAIAMAIALLANQPWSLAAGGLLYQAASIFDGVDGEMARASFRSTAFGAMLDSLIDTATNIAFLLGIVWTVYLNGPEWALYCGIWASILLPLGLTVIAMHTRRAGKPFTFDIMKEGRIRRDGSRPVLPIVQAMTIGSSRDVYALLCAIFAVAGLPQIILAVYAGAVLAWLCAIFLILIRPARDG